MKASSYSSASASSSIPFTERYNPLSAQLDGSLSPGDFIRTLRSCDSQIFGGFEGECSLLDTPCIDSIHNVARACSRYIEARGAHVIKSTTSSTIGSNASGSTSSTNNDNASGTVGGSSDEGVIVMGGCGTSGRIAYLISVRFNKILESLLGASASPVGVFSYSCAGGDSALLLSDEMPEDDPALGLADFVSVIERERKTRDVKSAYYIGITCGLSAPYCAGPVAYIVQAGDVSAKVAGLDSIGAALVGFNPVGLSRNAPIHSWPAQPSPISSEIEYPFKTFRDVTVALNNKATTSSSSSSYRYSLINPVLGPEPVAGSSRM